LNKKSDLIFLTGTINPNTFLFLKLLEPKIRQNQYINAIKFYLNNTKLKILFVENSNVDISSFFTYEIRSNRLEILTFPSDNFNEKLGKGYGEMSIIEYGVLNSKLIKQANNIYKITGRLKVLNINYIINYYLKLNKKIISVYFNDSLNFCDSRIFISNSDFYHNYLIKHKYLINDLNGIFFEHVLSKATLKYIIDNENSFLQFPTIPRIEGVSGTNGAKYNSSFIFWFKKLIKYKIKIYLFKDVLIK